MKENIVFISTSVIFMILSLLGLSLMIYGDGIGAAGILSGVLGMLLLAGASFFHLILSLVIILRNKWKLYCWSWGYLCLMILFIVILFSTDQGWDNFVAYVKGYK